VATRALDLLREKFSKLIKTQHAFKPDKKISAYLDSIQFRNLLAYVSQNL